MPASAPTNLLLPPASGAAPFTISARTALAITGMSWDWVLKFARTHGVEIFRVGSRKQLIAYQSFAAAVRRHSTERRDERALSTEYEDARLCAELGVERAPKPELTFEQERARLRAELALALRRSAGAHK